MIFQVPVFAMVSVSITPAAIAELLLQMGDTQFASETSVQTMQSTELDEKLSNAAVRLLQSLRSDEEAGILGPQIVREITYLVLRGKLGKNLRVLAASDSYFGQISRVLNRMHTDFARSYDMTRVAREIGMSVATFMHASEKSPQHHRCSISRRCDCTRPCC